MKSFFANILSLQKGEGSRVTSLLTMGFLMGMFLATITVASSSLFLANFVEEDSLPKAFLFSGVIGLLATITYNLLQNRIPFALLGGLSVLVISVLTGLLEFGVGLFTDPKVLYFVGFTLILPFTYLLNLVFWGSFARLFNTRQSKRLLSTVDAGAMIATFIAYFSIPQILKSFEHESSLYAISLISIVLFFIVFLYLSSGHLNKVRSFREEKEFYKKVTLGEFLRNRYLLYLSAFVIVSMLAMNFVDYSFLNVTTLMLAEKDYARFISYFGMTVVVFNFLFQTFATQRIVSEYGMRVAMLINPVLIGLFTLAAIIVGYYFGYSRQDELFVVFFICVAMSKLFIASLRDALDNQTFRLYLLPLEQNIRIDVQTKIEGMVTAFASLLAGALIILLNTIKVFDFFSITAVTLPLVGAWYFISNRLNKGYRSTLQDTLAFAGPVGKRHAEKAYTVNVVLNNGLESPVEGKVMYVLKLMEKLEPVLYENVLVSLANSMSGRVREFVGHRMKVASVIQGANNEIRGLASKAADHVEDSDQIGIALDRLIQLGKSRNREDRVLAARMLSTGYGNKAIFILLELLRDPEPAVRYAGLNTARKIRRPETWPVLVELLRSPAYSHHAAAALQQAGESVLPTLETAFNRIGQNDIVMLRIVQIMGRIGGEYALKLLWRKTQYPDKRIVKQILYSLRYKNHQANAKEALEVNGLLDTEIGKTIWNLAALNELPATREFLFLREALDEEVAANYDQITLLLSLLYDPQSVQMVKENIASGDPDSIAFALELMDMFVDPGLKPRLFPLFDDSSVEEKLHNLQLFYPRESYNPVQVINYLLNRDYNLTNRWTKACAIHATAFMPDFRVNRGLVSQVFNPDKLLQETAAWVLWLKNKKIYETVVGRLSEADKKYLHSSLENNALPDGLNDGFFLDIEMIMFIKQLRHFNGIHGAQVSELAQHIVTLNLEDGTRLSTKPEQNGPIFIVAKGVIRFDLEDNTDRTMNQGGVYGDIFHEGEVSAVVGITAIGQAIVFKIDIMDFYFVMVNNHELIEGLIKNITPEEVSSGIILTNKNLTK